MIRAISHGKLDSKIVADSQGIERSVEVTLSFVITSVEEDELVRGLNEVVDRYAI